MIIGKLLWVVGVEGSNIGLGLREGWVGFL